MTQEELAAIEKAKDEYYASCLAFAAEIQEKAKKLEQLKRRMDDVVGSRRKQRICKACDGNGHPHGYRTKCQNCGGTGVISSCFA